MSITVNGLKANYIKGGNPQSEKTIFLMHGSNMCAKMLVGFIEPLSQYNVILPDIIGHGETEGVTPNTVAEQAEFVEAFLIALKEAGEITDDVFVAGYSLGGCIATEIGLKNLPFVTGIGIFNSCDFKNTHLNGLIPADIATFDPNESLGMITGPKHDLSKLAVVVANPQKLESAHADLYAASQYDTADLTKINVPILFVTGESDRLAILSNVLKLHLAVPTSRLNVIPYRGHSSLFEAPEEYTEAIVDLFTYGTTR